MARSTGATPWSALLGLGLLAVVAFAVGAFAGLVWKEPGLVAAYVRGDTTEVAWSTTPGQAADAVPAPDVPVEEPQTEDAEAPAPALAAAPSPEAKPPDPPAPPRTAPAPAPVAAAPPEGRIAVQVGAFGARDAAVSLRDRLEGAGFPTYLVGGAARDEPWRVRVGPFASRDEAALSAHRLEKEHQLPTWVLDEDAE